MLEQNVKIESNNRGLLAKYVKNTVLFAAVPAAAMAADYFWIEEIIKVYSQIDKTWTASAVRVGTSALMIANLAAIGTSISNFYQLCTNPFRAKSRLEFDNEEKTVTRTVYNPRKNEKSYNCEKIEDIQVTQTLLEKILDVGTLYLTLESTVMRKNKSESGFLGDFEPTKVAQLLDFEYVNSPHKVKDMLTGNNAYISKGTKHQPQTNPA